MVGVDHDTGINDVLGGVPTVQDIMALHDNSLVVVTKLIKCRGWLIRRQVSDGIKPSLLFIQVKVKNAWIPICITCEDDMWQGVPFFICKWAESNIQKAISNADGDDVFIIGKNVL